MKTNRAARIWLIAIAIGASVLSASTALAQVRYVDDDAPGGGDGMGWATAYNDLQAALSAASSAPGTITEIRVAQGVYKPSLPSTTTNTRTFTLLDNVTIRGGYAGRGQPDPDQWLPGSQPSVLSGDHVGNDTPLPALGTSPTTWNENSFHVVTASNTKSTAVLDGFVIEHGNAKSGTNPERFGGGIVNYRTNGSTDPGATIRNCLIHSNYAEFGGGMNCENGASATVINCVFADNLSGQEAGGYYCNSTVNTSQIRDCTFRKNRSTTGGGLFARQRVTIFNSVFNGNQAIHASGTSGGGGGIYTIAVQGFFQMRGCTLSGNLAWEGGGMDNRSGGTSNAPDVANCVFYGNTAVNAGPNVINVGSTPTFRHSLIQGSGGSSAWVGAFGTNLGGNKDANPMFVDADGADNVAGTADDDLRLLSTSPAVDAGSNALVPAGVTTDRDGNPRFTNDIYTIDTGVGTAPIVDMGAYELVDGDGDTVPDTIDNCVQVPNTSQTDTDADGVGDACDNCPTTSNSDQLDSDGDLDGNVCDNCPATANSDQADTDLDGLGNVCDNCPTISNALQQNADGDVLGDACDPCPNDPANDADGDTVCGNIDNCPIDANGDQVDNDFDGAGDVCDPDDDNDGVLDGADNCPFNMNALQANNDNDTLGDACDLDDDNDGVADAEDNCPFVANAGQSDNDFDGLGDACDTDDDNDTIADTVDNCPLTANSDQSDNESDGLGDACDPDDDNDGVLDAADNCPFTVNPDQAFHDADGLGDACDDDDDDDGILDGDDNCPLAANINQEDADSDGIGDACDACTDTDNDGFGNPSFPNSCETDNCPLDPNAGQDDNDLDLIGDVCDPDDDNDGIADVSDNCPLVSNFDQSDTDNDAQGDACDGDDDGDGVLDETDNCPLSSNPTQTDGDEDGVGDACDNCQMVDNVDQLDTDSDGLGDACDNCPTSPNHDQTNNDSDSQGDACDPDDDNDGVVDLSDNCPFADNDDQADQDGDGLGDACDLDDDDDGILDVNDNCPLAANPSQINTDGDSLGDACDDDDDNDGVLDTTDNCPLIANSDQDNSDADSDGNACDPDDDNDGVLDGSDNCPLVANADQLNTDSDLNGDVCDLDDDNDGLSDTDEVALGTNPLDSDSDDDGITDGAEVAAAAGGSCPSPLNPDSDNDGLTDLEEVNMGFSPCNKRPSASAVVQQLTSIGTLALVNLDGSGSFDGDDDQATLTIKWTVDSTVVFTGPYAMFATITVPLAYGSHDVTLRVTDPVGGWHETSSTILLNPAQLSVFEIDTVNVRFGGGSTKTAKLTGEIGLPFGVNYTELNSIGTAQIVLAGITIAPTASLDFTEHGSGGKKWRYESNTGPITRFDIDWDGARFKYNKNHFPIEFESQLISTTETVLTMRFDRKKLSGAVTVNINNQAIFNIAPNGTVSGAMPIDVEKPGKEVTLTLPFPLTETSIITISGAQNRTIQVDDHLTASVGRFRIETNFNGALFPNGVNTLPRTISAAVTIGTEAYPGSDTVSAPKLSKEGQNWVKSSCD